MGLAEGTAAFIAPDNTVHVERSRDITRVNGADVQFTSMDTVNKGPPVGLPGEQLHNLTQGATLNFCTRQTSAGR